MSSFLASRLTIRRTLHDATGRLRAAGSDSPTLDAQLLLAHSLGVTRERLYAAFNDAVPPDAFELLQHNIARRCQGVPVPYLTGTTEFFGLSFTVNESVLVPRPDTETLVEVAGVTATLFDHPTIHDAFTGSGCVACAVSLLCPESDVSASDISPEALEVASQNSSRLTGGRVRCRLADCLPACSDAFDIITANPPYIEHTLLPRRSTGPSPSSSPGWEPPVALDGGVDGLRIVHRLIVAALAVLKDNGYILVEVADHQAKTVEQLFLERGYTDVFIRQDLAGRNRVIGAKKARS